MPPRPMAPPAAAPASRPARPPLTVVAGLTLVLALASTSAIGPGTARAEAPAVTIETAIDGVDADAGPGPIVEPGETLSWTWTVTATGTVTLYDLVVTDSGGTTPDCDVNGDGVPDGTAIHPGPLAPGQSYTCTASGQAGAASAGTIQTLGRVRAVDFAGTTAYTADDPAHHTPLDRFEAQPGVTIRTLVNGEDPGSGTGPFVAEGSPMTLSYVVTNTGNVPLRAIEVRGDSGLAVDCGSGSAAVSGPLAPGASVTCVAAATAAGPEAGRQSPFGAVLADALDPATGEAIDQVQDTDAATYVPVELPGRLAFTGPTDGVVPIGLASLALGGGLLGLARIRLSRRRAPTPIPVRTEPERTG